MSKSNTDPKGKTFYVGVDVGQEELVVAVEGYRPRSFKNNPGDVQILWNWVSSLACGAKVHFCMEATGVYGHSLASLLHSYEHPGLEVSVVNPAQIRAFAKAQLRRTKTDRVDAQVILAFAQSQKPRCFLPEPEELQQLYHLVTQAEALRQEIQIWRNRAHAYKHIANLPKVVGNTPKSVIRSLKRELTKVEKAIKDLCTNNPNLDQKVKLLCSIVGIGELSAVRLLAYGRSALVDRDQKALTAHAGLAPAHRQSGISIHGKGYISKQGNRKLRKTLYMPAVCASRYNPIISRHYQNLVQRGKPKKLALVACMRKLLVIAQAILKHQTPFNPDFLALT